MGSIVGSKTLVNSKSFRTSPVTSIGVSLIPGSHLVGGGRIVDALLFTYVFGFQSPLTAETRVQEDDGSFFCGLPHHKKNFLALPTTELCTSRIWFCHGLLLGQSFALSGCGRGPLQDEDHSWSRPHSFPDLYSMRSGRAPEWFRSGPVVAGSLGNRRDVLMRLVCGFPFYWTLLTTFLWPFPQFPQKLELCSLPAIWEHSSFVPSCS